MKKLNVNLAIFIGILVLYVAGQALIGTYHPDNKQFRFDAPSDVDFLYYGAIINTVLDSMPPENPAFGGVKLTQPFIQYYPAAMLAGVFNPYNSIRILNIIYLILFWLLLKNLFPDKYGLPLVILFASSTFGAEINSLGVDLIARGFTHAPFFILLAAAIFCRKLSIRLAAVFAAALINGYLMLIAMIYFGVMLIMKRSRVNVCLIASSLVGLVIASIIVYSQATHELFYTPFVRAFAFNPIEIIKHAAPFIILLLFYRHTGMTVLLVISIIFGSLIHYNPFFPVFMVYLSGSMLMAAGERRRPQSGLVGLAVTVLLCAGFIVSAYGKYNPHNRNYYPRYDSRLDRSINWVLDNTDDDDVFLALLLDNTDLALIMQHRPVYLGYIGHVAHLRLNWQDRYNQFVKMFATGQAPKEVGYIYFGPVENKYFPEAHLSYPIVYQDEQGKIYKTKRDRLRFDL
ncbi:MAG: hypothetical protein JSU69_03375 [Candidatus Zixiibacteriota bacterium]|nr:MAG: hypothetical protein JSU69_03375 [candidate division Zixibacteria bacterium]